MARKPNGIGRPLFRIESGFSIGFKCEAERRPRSVNCRYHKKDGKLSGRDCLHLTARTINSMMTGIFDECICEEAMQDRLFSEKIMNNVDLKDVIMNTVEETVDSLVERVNLFKRKKAKKAKKQK